MNTIGALKSFNLTAEGVLKGLRRAYSGHIDNRTSDSTYHLADVK